MRVPLIAAGLNYRSFKIEDWHSSGTAVDLLRFSLVLDFPNYISKHRKALYEAYPARDVGLWKI